MDQLLLFFNEFSVRWILSILTSFFITWYSIPIIVRIARGKNLFAISNNRTIHNSKIPVLGGVAIFTSYFISTLLFTKVVTMPHMQYVIAGAVLIFIIGLKDDLISISWKSKAIGELIAIIIIVVLGNIRFTSLHGFMGINEINYLTSFLITVFVMLVITNSINLIDGIDGLASGIAMIASLTFGAWFYLSGNLEYAIKAFSLAAALVAYARYNWFANKNKTFMGDTGSLLLGYLLAIFTVQFNQMNLDASAPSYIASAPSVSIAILIIPLFDTLRVFIIRILRNGSPFKADRRHMHHLLLALGFTHLQASCVLFALNILVIVVAFTFQNVGILWLGLIEFAILLLFASILDLSVRRKKEAGEPINYCDV